MQSIIAGKDRLKLRHNSENISEKSLLNLRYQDSNKAKEIILKSLSGNYDESTKEIAAYVSQKFSSMEVKNALLKLIEATNSVRVKITVIDSLSDISRYNDKEIEKHLVKIIKSDNSDWVRERASWVLGRVGTRKSEKKIKDLLKNENDKWVRSGLIWSLGELGSPTSVGVLKEQLKDSHWENRKLAVLAISKVNEKVEIKDKIEIEKKLLELIKKDKNEWVRRRASLALGKMWEYK